MSCTLCDWRYNFFKFHSKISRLSENLKNFHLREVPNQLQQKLAICSFRGLKTHREWNSKASKILEDWTRPSRFFGGLQSKRNFGFTCKFTIWCKFLQTKCKLFTSFTCRFSITFSQTFSGNSDQHVALWKF